MTLDRLAKHVGVVRQTSVAIEKGNCSPSGGLVIRIAPGFVASVEEFFSLRDERPKRSSRRGEQGGRVMRVRMGLLVLVVAAMAMASGSGSATAGTAARPTVKIGVYDSRVVALAYARSGPFMQHVTQMRKDLEEARAKNDTTRIKELEAEGPAMQVRLHQQAFSTAGVTNIMAKVADVIPGIARDAGVVLIVSKWEMPYRDASIEIVDVSLPIAMLFKPDERTLKIIGQMKDMKPVPFDEISLNPND
jgi:DNA-binding XRE family transcriptional regulator